jgi:hypothetical protein
MLHWIFSTNIKNRYSLFLTGSYYYFSTGKRLTKLEREQFSIDTSLNDTIIGLTLGDLHIRKQPASTNVRFCFEQGLIHEEYILHLYELFKNYCMSGLKYSTRKPDKRTGNIYSRVTFTTYSLPCLNIYHELFYRDGKKIIPNNIEELLTARALAYWAMDDGSKNKNNFYFNTDSYTKEEVQLLIDALKNKFDLDTSMHKMTDSNYRIFIRVRSMSKFKDLVTPYFHESMMYKLL